VYRFGRVGKGLKGVDNLSLLRVIKIFGSEGGGRRGKRIRNASRSLLATHDEGQELYLGKGKGTGLKPEQAVFQRAVR